MLRAAKLQADPRLPMLVTGIAGVPGYNALEYLEQRYPGQVIGVTQQDNARLIGPGIVHCNMEDRDSLRRLFDKYQFQSVLNCAGCCALKACEIDTRLAWRTNVEGLVALLSLIVEQPIRLVHLSVDLVYSGIKGGLHYEDDRTDPVTVYGKTMVSAEQMIEDWYPQACVLRISLPMGVSSNGHAGAIDWILSRFKKHRPATLYYDEVRTPTYTCCLNRLYEAALASDITGVFHAGASRRLSLYQIGQVINRVGGHDPDLLMGCMRHAAGPVPPRAGDVSMNCDKLIDALGYMPFDPWPLDERFVPTHRHWHYERYDEPGSPELLSRVLARNPRFAGKSVA